MHNSYRLKKTLAVPLMDVLPQTTRNREAQSLHKQATSPHKQASRVATRSVLVRQ